MANKYCMKSGSDSNNGLTPATAKLTITALLNILAAGDTGYVGPGTYREHADFSSAADGSSGSRIRLIADVTGENTDNIGGLVRITGSDDDQTATRSYGMTVTNRQYWDIENFAIDTCASYCIYGYQSAHMRIRRCFMQSTSIAAFWESTLDDLLMDGNIIFGAGYRAIETQNAGTDHGSSVFQNNIIVGGYSSGEAMRIQRGGCTVNNNYIQGYAAGVFTSAAGSTITAVNNIITGCQYGMRDDTGANRITQSNNCLYSNEGANFSGVTGTVAYPYPPLLMPWLTPGSGIFARSPVPFMLMPDSELVNVGGSSPPTTDAYGNARPQGTAACIGPVEKRHTWTRQSGTVRTGSYAAQLVGRDYHDTLIDVTSGVAVTASVYTKWDDNTNIGAKPRIELIGCGFDATPVDATGNGSTSWEQLSITDTPTVTGTARVRIYNRSTHTSAINAYFDDLTVT